MIFEKAIPHDQDKVIPGKGEAATLGKSSNILVTKNKSMWFYYAQKAFNIFSTPILDFKTYTYNMYTHS